jgi:hypothetical protein
MRPERQGRGSEARGARRCCFVSPIPGHAHDLRHDGGWRKVQKPHEHKMSDSQSVSQSEMHSVQAHAEELHKNVHSGVESTIPFSHVSGPASSPDWDPSPASLSTPLSTRPPSVPAERPAPAAAVFGGRKQAKTDRPTVPCFAGLQRGERRRPTDRPIETVSAAVARLVGTVLAKRNETLVVFAPSRLTSEPLLLKPMSTLRTVRYSRLPPRMSHVPPREERRTERSGPAHGPALPWRPGLALPGLARPGRPARSDYSGALNARTSVYIHLVIPVVPSPNVPTDPAPRQPQRRGSGLSVLSPLAILHGQGRAHVSAVEKRLARALRKVT